MTRAQINRWTAILPVVMSLAALALVGAAVATGWERDLTDEGIAAHLFQMLIVAEVPVVALFLGTADRGNFRRVAGLLAMQIAALGAALGSVALFHL